MPKRCNALGPERDVAVGEASRRAGRTNGNQRSTVSGLWGTGGVAEPRAGHARLGLSVRQSKHVGRRKGCRAEKPRGRSAEVIQVAGTPGPAPPTSPASESRGCDLGLPTSRALVSCAVTPLPSPAPPFRVSSPCPEHEGPVPFAEGGGRARIQRVTSAFAGPRSREGVAR